jgi:hypothetical protein
MQVLKVAASIVLGVIGLLTLIIGFAAPFYEERFNERRERFLREGKPIKETVLTKVAGRKGKYLVAAPAGTPQPAAGVHPEGKWVRVSPAEFARYDRGDPIELLVIGEEYFLRDSEFYTVLRPMEATALFGITGVVFLLVRYGWKIEQTPSGAAVV